MDDVQMSDEQPSVIISDADVLIDYLDTDPEILGLISENLWKVHIPRPVFECTDQLDEGVIKEQRLQIVDPEEFQFMEVAERQGRLSEEDRLCFVLARDMGCDCWTNDKRLRGLCDDNDIRCHWGLAPMITLVEAGVLTAVRAIKTAENICANNPHYIKKWIIDDFKKRISRIKEVDDG